MSRLHGVQHGIGSLIMALVLSGVFSGRAFAADTTPPSAPTQPTEGSSTSDKDYDTNGSYTVYWKAASDVDSGISAYELQERIGPSGTWTTLTATTTKLSYAVSGRLHNTRYFYQVRAKNGAGLWGAWSPVSDGMLVDTTPPTPVTVTDDGDTTASTTTLHATWTPAVDPESGLEKYQYIIRRDSATGSTIVGYASVGLATEVTRANLSLTDGVTYFIGVRARNNADLWSATTYADGITVTTADVTPPSGSVLINDGTAVTNTPTVTLTLSATDDKGSVTSMRFSNDNVTYADPPEAYATTASWTLTSGDGLKTVYAQFQDAAGNWNAASPATDTITLDTAPPLISGVSAGELTTTSVTLTWTTEEPTSSHVEYGLTTAYGSLSPTDEVLVTTHRVVLTGLHAHTTYHARAVSQDAASNLASSADVSFTTPNTAPVLSPISDQMIAEGDTLAVTLSATDADGDALTYAAAPLPDGASISGATFTWTPSYEQAGSYGVTVSVSDGIETVAELVTITVTDAVLPDTAPPTGSVTINGGAAVTTELNVTLTLSASDAEGMVTEMQFSNDGVIYSTPEPYAMTKAWTLISGDGLKTVYAQFRDTAGNWSAPATDTIELNATAPTFTIDEPQPNQVFTAE